LADGNLISKKIANALPKRDEWGEKDIENIKKELLENHLFLTNIVKCCYDHADYPEEPVIQWYLEWLKQEIKIVNPQSIVAFGALVFKTLTGQTITFKDYLNSITQPHYFESLTGRKIPVVPCVFPVGRGDPAKAAYILRTLSIH